MKRLYIVHIRRPEYFYVIAETFSDAAQEVKIFLTKNEWYFLKDRDVVRVELLAEANKYTNAFHLLPIVDNLEGK